MATSPVFSEVIGITFDTTGFAASLDKLRTMFSEALSEMGGTSIGAVVETGSSQEALSGLSKQLAALGTTITETFKTVSTDSSKVITEMSDKTAEKVEDATTKTKRAWRDALDEMAQAARENPEAFGGGFNTMAGDYLSKGLDPGQLTQRAQSQMYKGIGANDQVGSIAQYDDTTARQQEWHQRFASSPQKDDPIGKQLADADALDKKLDESAKKSEERDAKSAERDKAKAERDTRAAGVAQSVAIDRDKALDASAAKEEQAAGVKQSVAEKMNDDLTRKGGLSVLAAEKEGYDRQLETFRKYAQDKVQVSEFTTKEIAALSQDELVIYREMLQEKQVADERFSREHFNSTQKMIEQDEKAAAASARSYEKAAAQKAKASGGGSAGGGGGVVGSFTKSFSDNFSTESLGNFAGMSAAFMGIGLAIGAVTKAASEMVDLFKSGVEYAQEMEQTSAKLQGIITSNVTLSSDFVTNFHMAGEAATQIHKKFQDASIQYGINVEILERGFKALVDGGGVSLVRNLDEATHLATLFGVALQAAGKDADTSRAIMSELPKMLNGTVKPTSFILETLGMTNVQWEAMVSHAKTHRDLLDEIAPRMAAYEKVAEEAGNRQMALTQSIKLEVERIMADGEKDIFSSWTGVLKEVKQYLEDNRKKIEDIVTAITQVVLALGDVLKSVFEVIKSVSLVKPGLDNVLGVAEGIAWHFRNIALDMKLVADLASAMKTPEWKPGEEAAKLTVAYDTYQKGRKELGPGPGTDGYERFQKLAQWKREAKESEDRSVLEDTPGGKGNQHLSKTPNNNDPLAEMQKKFKYQSDLSKSLYDQEILQNHALTDGKHKSIDEIAKTDSESSQAEHDRQIALIVKEREAMKTLPKSVKPSAIVKADEGLDIRTATVDGANEKRKATDQNKLLADAVASQDKEDQHAIESAKKVATEKIGEANRAHTEIGKSETETLKAITKAQDEEKASVDKSYDNLIARAGTDDGLAKELSEKKKDYDDSYTAKAHENSLARTKANQDEYVKSRENELRPMRDANAELHAANDVKINPMTDPDGRKAAAQSAQTAQSAKHLADAEERAAWLELEHAKKLGILGSALDVFKDKLEKAKSASGVAGAVADNNDTAAVNKSPEAGAIADLGSSFKSFGDDSKSFGTKFTDGTVALTEAIDVFHTSVNSIISGFKNGGILGGAGAAASSAGGAMTSLATDVGKNISGALGKAFASAGPIVGAIGGLFSAISSIFQQEVADEVASVQKAVQTAMSAYQNQQATLVQTLAAVQAQEAAAIAKLSGMKGGQAALSNLLPGLDNQIAQLELQIKMTKISFNNQLQDLQLNNTALSSVFDKWQQINTAVQAYLGAGGDVAVANKLISDTLRDMQKAAGDSLNQGYQSAIADAVSLNNLIQQRMQMEYQESQTEFNTINSDAVERRGTKAIDTGTQLQQEKAQYQLQMQTLNSQIDLTQQKVGLEGQMFNLAMSTAQLQAASNTLQIQQLQEQLVILQGQKDIYDGITKSSNGQYSASQTLMNQIGIVNITVVAGGTAGDDTAANPQNAADAVAGVLKTWTRSGFGTSLGGKT